MPRWEYSLMVAMVKASRSSMRATGRSHCMVSMTALQAASTLGKVQMPVLIASGMPAGADRPAPGQDDAHALHVVRHGAVAHGVGSGCAGGGHAAESGVGTGIDGEEQTGVAQVRVELSARHAGLHAAVEILHVDFQDLVHVRGVDADAAFRRGDVSLQRGSGTVGNHRDPVARADLHDLHDFLLAFRKGNRIGGQNGVPGGVVGMQRA